MSYYYKNQPNKTSTVSKCSDGTPRFYCSNSTPGKYCDGLGKLVTLARCSAAASTPAATDTSCAAVGGTCKLAAQYGDEDLGKKDCGFGRSCYKQSEAAKQARINYLKGECGKKGCGVISKKDCLKTQMCESQGSMGPIPGGMYCVYEPECAQLAVDMKSLQSYTNTTLLEEGSVIEGVGDYRVVLQSVDTTAKNVVIKVTTWNLSPSVFSKDFTESKILSEGSSYKFLAGKLFSDGGIVIKVKSLSGKTAELEMTYKG